MPDEEQKSLHEMTEEELREVEVIWPESSEELIGYIDTLIERNHDYGTCVYAMSMAAVAAFHYVAKKLGTTGFQAGMADLDILRRTRRIEGGFYIRKYRDLLYPQRSDRFRKEIDPEIWQWLQEEAQRKLDERGLVHPAVAGHWKSIVDGHVPHGFTIKKEEKKP